MKVSEGAAYPQIASDSGTTFAVVRSLHRDPFHRARRS